MSIKKTLAILLFLLFLFPLAAQNEKKIVILHTNDLHSRLMGYAPESAYSPMTINDDKTVGGFARIATIIRDEKEKNEGTTLIVDGGDFLMGTLFQGLETKTGFQLRLMKTIGYDVVCIGNHEFDYGPAKLACIVNSGLKKGDIPPVLLSNAVFNSKDPGDDTLEELFISNTIGRKLIIERDGLKIGFFSILGKVADNDAAFAPPVTFSNQIKTAKKMVRELQDDKCDIIICLSHSGVSPGESGEWSGEDIKLAEKVKGIHAVISGHTHTRLDKPILVKGTPVVQTGAYGKFVGKLILTYSDGNVRFTDYSLIPVDDRIVGDASVNELIEEQKEAITKEILEPLEIKYDRNLVETDFSLVCDENGDIKNSNLGPLIADAISGYVNNHSEKGTDISIVAAGVIRDMIVPGFQTAPDIFNIMSMGEGKDSTPGYPLARVYVTGKELKSILEILQVAYKSTPGYYCYYSGLKVDFDPEKGMLRKINRIDIITPGGDVKEVNLARKEKELYSITASLYMLEFVGIIKKMSFGLINVVPKDASGNPVIDMKTAVIDIDESVEGIQEGKEWLALVEYLTSMNDTNGNGIPDIDRKYKSAIQTFFNVNSR
jgi:5'-nucleotidase/UDP-sugar diphosphatase